MSLESNHAAAGTAATTARGEMKQEWYKKPTALHFTIAAGVIAIALVINYSFEFNFFWKLLLSGALVWGGGKIAASKIGSVKLWGNIFRGLGWVIFAIALAKSGARVLLERAVIKADEKLTELAATVETTAGTASTPGTSQRLQLQDGQIIPVNLKNVGERQPVDVRMTLNDTARVEGGFPKDKKGVVIADGVTAYSICGQVKEPGWILRDASAPKRHMGFLNKSVGFSHDMQLTDDMKKFLVQNQVSAVTVSFYLVLTTVATPIAC